ncbi:MAG TPA: VIT domain-containing protein [Gemmataceae bacterium]|nr:VIT domain-containing protein [Gemmataceae bacterium]
MRRLVPVLFLALAWAGPARSAGLLIPSEPNTAPLDLVNHHVSVTIDEQVAVTKVEQTFRNHTDRQLEATYVFPVPKGASVNKFAMWVNGKEVKGEMVEADRATSIYTDIVRRLQDPGLLEYMGNNLLRLRVFPIPPRGDQKVSVSFTCVAASDAGLTEYVYPLRTDSKASRTLEKFSLDATIKSEHGVQNVYSPTHAVKVTRTTDHEARVKFEAKGGTLDKDFQLFYALAGQDVGLTALTHRPVKDEDGYFLMLVSPRADLSKSQEVPRDMVFVLDTSGSMAGPKMEQAKKALKFCLGHLGHQDRFAIMNFATTVTKYADRLKDADKDSVVDARKWVDRLESTGGTAIDAAMTAALEMRSGESGRTFTVVFFTDGQPTVGETNPDAILKNVMAKRTDNTRIFTFGVGDDVNAVLLDRLADQTRAVSTYVRPEEDIEVKVSALYDKISHPVLTELKLTAGSDVTLAEMYPNELPDLFHGGQLVVLGRYRGHGAAALTLSGKVGGEEREFVYETTFPEKTGDDRAFVEGLWARRKVGYLLDQIRVNGEQKELKDEVIALAKKYGITTPYTSYLVVPDNVPVPVTRGVPVPVLPVQIAPGLSGASVPIGGTVTATTGALPAPHYLEHSRPSILRPSAAPMAASAPASPPPSFNFAPASGGAAATPCVSATAQTGTEGVNLALVLDDLRNGDKIADAPTKPAAGRTCVEVNGAWVDNGYDAKTPTLKVKAMSAAYFRILARHPEMKDVLRLGNRVVWVTPCGTALVIDADGKETLGDDEIDKLFVARK